GDTRDDWAKLILPDDRSRIIILVAKVQVMVKDDEVENNLAVFADRLSAEQGMPSEDDDPVGHHQRLLVRLHRVDPAGRLSSGGHYSAPSLSLGAGPLSNTESRTVLFCEFVSLFCRELEQASGFPLILRQPAAAYTVEQPEAVP